MGLARIITVVGTLRPGRVAALLFSATLAQADVTTFPVRPSATDPEIKAFDEPHWVYVDRDIVVNHSAALPQNRHELLLWLTGTGGKGHDAQGLANLATELGYHFGLDIHADRRDNFSRFRSTLGSHSS